MEPRLRREADGPIPPDGDSLLTWCSLTRSRRPWVAVREHVRLFDTVALRELFGDLYDIHRVATDPAGV
eukprot:9780700-Lingulodinium_polyedra.AAC.1